MKMSQLSWWVAVCMGMALVGHLFLISRLNVVEDESAYLQDAAQITASFLPFREFGGTKGPIYLFVLHAWQLIFGRTLEASRLFSIICHLVSIPIVASLAERFLHRRVAYAAAVFWAISPVVVSLTTNITHIPFELLLVLLTIWLLTVPSMAMRYVWAAGLVYFLAVISRATAAAFGPLLLYLVLAQPPRIKRVVGMGLSFLLALGLCIAIIYPLYGWPKTAFFFNADAVLIAGGQRAVYQAQESIDAAKALFLASQPVWIDSFILMGLALAALPVLAPRRLRAFAAALALLALWYGAGQLGMPTAESFQSFDVFELQKVLRVISVVVLSGIIFHLTLINVREHMSARWNFGLIALLWIGAFYMFYKGWGRSPTPFYPLESMPALSMMAALAGTLVYDSVALKRYRQFFLTLLIAEILVSLLIVPLKQYRGTVEARAAKEMAAIITERVPEGDIIFTAQPVFPYLANRELLGGYTHPGWYLSERAGYMPRAIRHMFLPDLPDLLQEVRSSADWIVVDWRTNDVYFNGGSEETKPFRDLLAEEYKAVATVKNPASRDILLYERAK